MFRARFFIGACFAFAAQSLAVAAQTGYPMSGHSYEVELATR